MEWQGGEGRPGGMRQRIADLRQQVGPRLKRLGAWLLKGLAVYMAIVVLLTIVYAFVRPPVSTMMIIRTLQGETVHARWVPLTKISPQLARAVIVAEDGRFCSHWGVDWTEAGAAVGDALGKGRLRGASTISMQTVKNLFLWPGRDPLRKLMELPLALLADRVWSKRRTLELYLNIAEWAPGVFGAELAARKFFAKPAALLMPAEAAELAARLPNPRLQRKNGGLSPSLRRRVGLIMAKMQRSGAATFCLAR